MNQARNARLLAAAVVALYSFALIISGVRPQVGLKQALSYVPAVIGVAVLAYDRWMWRWPIVHRFVARPDIAGIWQTTLEPAADSHIPPNKHGPIHAFTVVEQTYWTLHLTQVSAESQSVSYAATLGKVDGRRQQRLAFFYMNTPQQKHLPASPQHAGACLLNISDGRPATIEGVYFTNRLTRGDMRLIRVGPDTIARPYLDLVAQYPAP